MIEKFNHSWQLFKASLIVTLKYRKLLWFPVITTCLTAVITLFFLSAMALPVIFHHTGYHLSQMEHWEALKEHYLPAPPTSVGTNFGSPPDGEAPVEEVPLMN